VQRWGELKPPLHTCESVVAEACYLLRQLPAGSTSVLELLGRLVVAVSFTLQDGIQPLKQLINRFANIPMSLADACLVRMSELHSGSTIFTLDRDFKLYRKNGRQVIPLIGPEQS